MSLKEWKEKMEVALSYFNYATEPDEIDKAIEQYNQVLKVRPNYSTMKKD